MKTLAPSLAGAFLVLGSALVPSLSAQCGQNGHEAPTPMCAIDMGSNSVKRIVGSFRQGRYQQRHIEKRTLGVGDDVARYGRVSDPKFAEIEEALSSFKRSCEERGGEVRRRAPAPEARNHYGLKPGQVRAQTTLVDESCENAARHRFLLLETCEDLFLLSSLSCARARRSHSPG